MEKCRYQWLISGGLTSLLSLPNEGQFFIQVLLSSFSNNTSDTHIHDQIREILGPLKLYFEIDNQLIWSLLGTYSFA